MVLMFGIGSATAVIIGNTIGEGDYEKAKEYEGIITIASIIRITSGKWINDKTRDCEEIGV